ncbi:small subunit ribosomal protein S3 [Sporobacter termitidis DSM 10068]|uniref:Small ribosomal subunit protein uS3 n=1 Tax=Sporobacter termitidis DSM 10068 TaxID=1123282 RepID=A0A1M5VA87_9FIRM|nr:small subunit ribosomal protein S3 [Sporobacter termitidis DSM 10068]
MGQKVNPHGFRVGVIKDWDSRWYARNDKVGDLIVEDYNIRKYLKGLLYSASVPKIEIERDNAKIKILIHCARPGVVIGKGGQEIEKLRVNLEKRVGKPVSLSIVEVKSPDTNAQLVAESIAAKLEKRIGFRRAMKNAMQRAMRLGVRGIKVMVAGRLGGAEIARSETYHEGTIPLQTLRADIEYGFAEAATTYGRIGVKVWIYNGEILNQTLRTTPRTMDTSRPPRERRQNDRGDRGGYNRGGQGGYNRGGQGGYNRPAGQGGYNRGPGQGGYNRPAGQGGYNNRPAGQGGYNHGGQGGYNRPAGQGAAAGSTPPAAPAPQAPKEGGAQ